MFTKLFTTVAAGQKPLARRSHATVTKLLCGKKLLIAHTLVQVQAVLVSRDLFGKISWRNLAISVHDWQVNSKFKMWAAKNSS